MRQLLGALQALCQGNWSPYSAGRGRIQARDIQFGKLTVIQILPKFLGGKVLHLTQNRKCEDRVVYQQKILKG